MELKHCVRHKKYNKMTHKIQMNHKSQSLMILDHPNSLTNNFDWVFLFDEINCKIKQITWRDHERSKDNCERKFIRELKVIWTRWEQVLQNRMSDKRGPDELLWYELTGNIHFERFRVKSLIVCFFSSVQNLSPFCGPISLKTPLLD